MGFHKEVLDPEFLQNAVVAGFKPAFGQPEARRFAAEILLVEADCYSHLGVDYFFLYTQEGQVAVCGS